MDSEPNIGNKISRRNYSGILDPMPRSDWRVILAIVIGLGVLGSAYGYYKVDQATRLEYPKDNYQPLRYPSPPVRRVAGQPQAKEYDPHCRQPESAADGDLCAQWGAVKAVDESNRLVRVNILLSLILGALGVVATAIGAVLVYRSLVQSEEGLKAASDANQLARETAQRELRAYVSAEKIAVVGLYVGHKATFVLEIVNRGQTPAYDVEIWSMPLAVTGEPDRAKAFRKNTGHKTSKMVLGPSQDHTHTNASAGEITPESHFFLMNGGTMIYFGVITYRDAFKKRRRTAFKYFVDGSGDLQHGAVFLTACGRGNVAS
jgi:hypothetical protein